MEQKEGWARVDYSRKWHYFVDGRSLCRSYGVFDKVSLEQGNDNSPDNCAICKRKLAKRGNLRFPPLVWLTKLERCRTFLQLDLVPHLKSC